MPVAGSLGSCITDRKLRDARVSDSRVRGADGHEDESIATDPQVSTVSFSTSSKLRASGTMLSSMSGTAKAARMYMVCRLQHCVLRRSRSSSVRVSRGQTSLIESTSGISQGIAEARAAIIYALIHLINQSEATVRELAGLSSNRAVSQARSRC